MSEISLLIRNKVVLHQDSWLYVPPGVNMTSEVTSGLSVLELNVDNFGRQ